MQTNNQEIQKQSSQSHQSGIDANFNNNQFNFQDMKDNFFDMDFNHNQPAALGQNQNQNQNTQQIDLLGDDDLFWGNSGNNNNQQNNNQLQQQQQNQNQVQPQALKNEFQDFDFDFMEKSMNNSQQKNSLNEQNAYQSQHPPLPPKKQNSNMNSQSNSQNISRNNSMHNSQSSQKGNNLYNSQNQGNKQPINNQISQSSNAFQRKDSLGIQKQNSYEYHNQFNSNNNNNNNQAQFVGFDMNFQSNQANNSFTNNNQMKKSGSISNQQNQNNFDGFDFGFGGFGDINPMANSQTSSQNKGQNNQNQQQQQQQYNLNQFDFGEFNMNAQAQQSQQGGNNAGAQNYNDFYFGNDNNQQINQVQGQNIAESQFQYNNPDAFNSYNSYNNNNLNHGSLHKDKSQNKASLDNSQIQEKDEKPLTISQKLELGGSEFNQHQLKISQEQQYKQQYQNVDFDDNFNNNKLQTSQPNIQIQSGNNSKQLSHKSSGSSQHQQEQQQKQKQQFDLGSNFFGSGINNPMISSVGSEQSNKKNQQQDWNFQANKNNNANFFDTNFDFTQNNNNNRDEAAQLSKKHSQHSNSNFQDVHNNQFNNSNNFGQNNDFANNNWSGNNQTQNKQNLLDENFNFNTANSQKNHQEEDNKVQFWMQQKVQQQIFGNQNEPNLNSVTKNSSIDKSHNMSTSKKNNNNKDAFGLDDFGEISEATGGEDSKIEAQKYGFDYDQKTNEKDQQIANDSRRSDDFDDLLPSEIDLVKQNKRKLQMEQNLRDQQQDYHEQQQFQNIQENKNQNLENKQVQDGNQELAIHKQVLKAKQQALAEQINYAQIQHDNSKINHMPGIRPFSPLQHTQSTNLSNKRRSSIEEYALKKQMENQINILKPFDFEAQKQKNDQRRHSEGQAILSQQIQRLQQNLNLGTINEEELQAGDNQLQKKGIPLYQGKGDHIPNVNLILPSIKGQKEQVAAFQEEQIGNPLHSKSSVSQDDEDDYLDSPELKQKSQKNQSNNLQTQNNEHTNPSNPQIILAESDIIPYPDENGQDNNQNNDFLGIHKNQNILESEVIKPQHKNSLSPRSNIGNNRQILQSEYLIDKQVANQQLNTNFKPTLTESYVEIDHTKDDNRFVNMQNYTIQNFVKSENVLPSSDDEAQQTQQKVGTTVSNRESLEKSVEQTIEEIKFDIDDFPMLENQLNTKGQFTSKEQQNLIKRQLSIINEEFEQVEDPDQNMSQANQEKLYEQRLEQIKSDQIAIHNQLAEIKNQTILYEEEFKKNTNAKEDDLERIKNQLKAMQQNQQKIKSLKDRYKQNLQFIMLIEYKKAALSVEKMQAEISKLQENSNKSSSLQGSQKQMGSSSEAQNSSLIESLKKEIQDLKQQMNSQYYPKSQISRQDSQDQKRKYSENEIAIIEDLRIQMNKLKSDFESKYNEQSSNLSAENKSTMIEFMEKLSQIEKNIIDQKEEIQRLASSQNDIQKQFMSISRTSNQYFSPLSQDRQFNQNNEDRKYGQETHYQENPQISLIKNDSQSEQGEAELFPRNEFIDKTEQEQSQNFKQNPIFDENEYKSVRGRYNNQEDGVNFLTPSKSSPGMMEYSPIISQDQQINHHDYRSTVGPRQQFYSQQQYQTNENTAKYFYQGDKNNQLNYSTNNREQNQYNPDQVNPQQINQDENQMNNSMLKNLYERTASHTLLYEQNQHLKSIYQDPYVLMKAFEAQKVSQLQFSKVQTPYDVYGSFQNNRIQQRLRDSVYSGTSQIFNEAINFSINSYKVNYVASNYNMGVKNIEKSQFTNQMLSEHDRYYDPLIELAQKQLGKEYFPNNEWFEKNIKQFVNRVNIEKRVLKDSIVNQNCVILETFDLQVSAKYSIVKTTNSSGKPDPRYPSQILKIQLTYTNKLGMNINNLLIVLASAKGYETVLADPPKIIQNQLKAYETIYQDVYLPNYRPNSQMLISQFSYSTGFKQSRVSALIPSTPNKFMDFIFINKEQFNQMWAESKDTMIYCSPVYLNTHIIQSCEDFKTIYPLLIEIVEAFEQYKQSWREFGGSFTILNDPYPNTTYLLKICFSQDQRVYFQFSSVGQDQVQSFNIKKVLQSILDLFYFLYCE
ncbi:hypothetical protein TTHERM_00128370 (macronuclear) [Tetrahymena thermophila SB210]|uniref:Uncharacterized protein n=1 Tax=Tetrahymena thermophila (strain SB210) TaxID=312017 RepID=I7MJ87_TETTS|nr:hypothetical protein TTHERM_00128370 [Tetrahymena thermophila SB210]EAR96073.2 hypothetical protein TTHERM_00128370 [Tetrahymena thermophila SB210]|eukprot:XP_001016318.2 hypothetical protein TTHERM_00128370 [Tetrahymena thermophila SB210]